MPLVHMTCVCTIPGPKEVTFGFDLDSPGAVDADLLDDLNEACAGQWDAAGTNMKSLFAAATVLVRVQSFVFEVQVNGTPPPPFKKQLTLGPQVHTANVPGTATGSNSIPQATMVCSFKTAISTRRTRGRIYLPPPPQGLISTDGRMSEANANLIETAVANLINVTRQAPVGFDMEHVVVSTMDEDLVTPVTSYVVKRRVDTQRRRLVRAIDTPT